MTERRTDRSEQVSPYDVVSAPNIETTFSPFVFKFLEFTVQRKIKKLNCATKSVIDSPKDSTEQLDALKNLSSLIVSDPRLSDHLCSKVFSHLFRFLQDKKSFEFQYYSAAVLENVLSSEIGLEYKDQAIPSLVKLIPSPDIYVQAEALRTLTKIADKFPDSCNVMIKSGVLDHLESLLTNKCNDFDSLKHGGQLFTALCRMKPHLPPNKLEKVVTIISTAINQNSPPVLLQVCLALSIISDQRLVKIGTEFTRLLDLILVSDREIVFCALHTIGNYVRWASDEDIQEYLLRSISNIRGQFTILNVHGVDVSTYRYFVDLFNSPPLSSHKFMIIRQPLLTNLEQLLRHVYTIVRKEACWILSNLTAVANSSQIQEIVDLGLIYMLVTVVRQDEFEVKEFAACAILNVLSGSEKIQLECIKGAYFPLLDEIRHCCHNDPVTVSLCSKILEFDTTYHTETSGEIPTNEEGRCNKLSSAVSSPPDPLIDSRVIRIMKDFPPSPHYQLTQHGIWTPGSLKKARSTKRAKISGNCHVLRLINRTPWNVWVLKRLSRKDNKLEDVFN